MNGCVDPSLSFSLVKLINEDGRLLPVPSDGSRPKKLLHFCQGMYRARSAYALPNKGMVTQQREVSLSFSLHSTMAQCYLFDVLPPCCVFPILPETFFHPSSPHIIHSFQPLAPFLSSLPIISRYLQQSVQVSWPTRIVDGRPLRSLWPTYVFGRWWLLYRIAYVGIVDDNQSHHGKEGNERRIFLNEYFVDFLQYFFR